MKIRAGFVSNSSSSSFIIKKEDLSESQIVLIKQHIEIAKKINETSSPYTGERRLGAYRLNKDGTEGDWDKNLIVGNYYIDDCDEWKISDYPDRIEGDTLIDNFDMEMFLTEIGIPKNVVKFGE